MLFETNSQISLFNVQKYEISISRFKMPVLSRVIEIFEEVCDLFIVGIFEPCALRNRYQIHSSTGLKKIR